jgi:hypothetical protein
MLCLLTLRLQTHDSDFTSPTHYCSEGSVTICPPDVPSNLYMPLPFIQTFLVCELSIFFFVCLALIKNLNNIGSNSECVLVPMNYYYFIQSCHLNEDPAVSFIRSPISLPSGLSPNTNLHLPAPSYPSPK